MSRETFLDYYENLPASPFKIFFFGGEPLINMELIRFVVPHLADDPRCQGFEIISNGLLLDKQIATFIKDWNIDFTWSYDGLSDERVGASRDKYPIELLREIVTELNVMVTPNNLKILDNHFFLKQFAEINPSFRILRDNVWTQEKVDEFGKEYHKYIQYLMANPDEISKNVYRDIEAIYMGVQKGTLRPDCKLFGSTTTLMPNGEEPLCYKMYASDVVDDYDVDVYKKCHTCSIKTFCEKGCYEQALKYGEPIEEICNLYKIIFRETARLDQRLSHDEEYTEFVRSIIE
jgi:radical SAM protein with 4Fe4S-binding SPASM domain